jgi:hypothetical protein
MTISDGFSLGIGIMLAFAAAIAVVFVVGLLITSFRRTGDYSLSANDHSLPANSYPYPPVRQPYQPNPVLPYTWLEQWQRDDPAGYQQAYGKDLEAYLQRARIVWLRRKAMRRPYSRLICAIGKLSGAKKKS